MKYFAKDLPVEGKGDIGCKWQWKNNIKNTGWEDISRSDMDAIIAHGLEPEPEFRKLKLFLCSRDIKIGDKVKTFNYPEQNEGKIINLRTSKKLVGAKDHSEIYHLADIQYSHESSPTTAAISNFFKVVGEISPEATWVKEGDEFDEDDFRKRWYSVRRETFLPHTYMDADEYTNLGEERRAGNLKIFIQIKGPCGHFH